MQVFKVYFKIIRSERTQIMIYVFVFLFITVMTTMFYTNPVSEAVGEFAASKPQVAVVNRDGDTPLLNGFIAYIGNHATLQDLPDNENALRDALFFHSVEYVMEIPVGFTQALIDGKPLDIQTATVPDSTSAVLLNTIVNRYFQTAALYAKYNSGLSQEDIASKTAADLSLSASVQMKAHTVEKVQEPRHMYFFNYLSYALFSILILGVSSFMLVFNQQDLKRRNLCAPMPGTRMNLQMFLANGVYGIACWLILTGFGFAMYFKEMATTTGVLLCLNAFTFMIACLGISFLLGTLIKKRSAQAGLQNILTLGTSFISGVFVPQFLLGKTVLSIASFTPTYWYVRGNQEIVDLNSFSLAAVSPILNYMLIMLGFGVAALAVALAVSRKKSLSGNL